MGIKRAELSEPTIGILGRGIPASDRRSNRAATLEEKS
jgi:hypothetical protein